MKKIVLLFTVLLITLKIFSIPATPFPVIFTQPDGSRITIRLHGDESFNYKTTIDGYLLISDESGILNYAVIQNNIVTSTKVKASDINKRTSSEKLILRNLIPNQNLSTLIKGNNLMRAKSLITGTQPQKSYPLTGKPKSLVILVNFSDKSFVTNNPQVAFSNLLNQKGYSTNGGTGSANDYFFDNSMGVFNPQFDVVGPFTLPQNMAFYGGNTSTAGTDTNPQQMVIDACNLAHTYGVNFSQYDTDNNTVVDNIFIYYAGYNEAEGGPANSIWPHKWNLNDYNTKFDGVSIFNYACTSELRSNSGSNMCGIGTFTHEFGHVLGLDDMYVTDATIPDHFTLYTWDIMDYGPYLNQGRTPPSYSSYERFYLKWLTPVELKTPQNVILDTLSTSNKAYLISQYGNHNLNGVNPNPVEFFLLENRQKKGWDYYLPGHGMLVTHIYFNASTWASNTPNNSETAMGVSIVEADNIGSETTMSGDPFPGTSNVTNYSPILRYGTNINKPLTYIKESNGIISFRFMGGLNTPTISTTGSPTTFSTIQGTASSSQTITVNAFKLISDVQLNFSVGSHFEMKRDTAKIWSKSITLTPKDSIINNIKIQIRYNPTEPSYRSTHTETLNLTSKNATTESVSLSGNSTRPIYVVTPLATDATNSTFTGFVANWNKVNDATGYYSTVYNLTVGQSTETQGFDNGLSAPSNWEITASNISNSTLYSGSNPPSLQFLNSGEYVQTQRYILPVTSLSFYIRSIAAYKGGFLIQAKNDDSAWEKIDSIPVSSNLYEKNKTYSLDESKGYNRFKFTYYKSSGSITFDDLKVGYSKFINYIQQDKWVTTNSDTLTSLNSGTQYFYKIKASDKTVNYENITDFSNIISVATFDYPLKSKLIAKVESTGDVTVYLPTDDTILYIYNLLGQNIRTITPQGSIIKLTDLPKKQVYILKAGNKITKIVN
ncbi:MAG: M6 family metalloprotease domain-containing protein [Paludibacter sp.]